MPTVGQILIDEALPPEMRGRYETLDKKSIRTIMQEVAEKYPDQYNKVLHSLMDVGRNVASTTGTSVTLRHLLPSPAKKAIIKKLKAENQAIIDNDEIDDETRDKMLVTNTNKYYDKLRDAVLAEGEASKSPYAMQVRSGGRGNPGQHASLVGSDLLVTDNKGDPVPVPIYNSYSDGLDPVEYWAAAYGARKGMIDVKFATADAGFLGKQLALAAHRQVVSQEQPDETRLPVGMVAETADAENEGAVLARAVGDIPAGTVLTGQLLEELKRDGHNKVLVASPLTSLVAAGGIDRWSAGRREDDDIASIGSPIGITSAQSISEPLSQGMLDSKHRSGAGGERIKRSGFEYINKLFQAPEYFHEAGPLSPLDGRVGAVAEAPQGGHYITIGTERIYAGPHLNVTVKPGQKIDSGDLLTDGVPHPKDLVKYRGIGEARRVFLNHAHQALQDSGINVRRRNLEPIVAGLINHIQVTNPDGYGDHLVDDVVPFNTMSANYKPREGSELLGIKRAKGRYLEEPALHYSVGTRITGKVLKDLQDMGIEDVYSHQDEPDFEPRFERLMTSSSRDPDWQTRLGGFYVGRSFADSVHRGLESDTDSTSFIPSLAQGSSLGSDLHQTGRY